MAAGLVAEVWRAFLSTRLKMDIGKKCNFKLARCRQDL
jgi:hypothetical protein